MEGEMEAASNLDQTAVEMSRRIPMQEGSCDGRDRRVRGPLCRHQYRQVNIRHCSPYSNMAPCELRTLGFASLGLEELVLMFRVCRSQVLDFP